MPSCSSSRVTHPDDTNDAEPEQEPSKAHRELHWVIRVQADLWQMQQLASFVEEERREQQKWNVPLLAIKLATDEVDGHGEHGRWHDEHRASKRVVVIRLVAQTYRQVQNHANQDQKPRCEKANDFCIEQNFLETLHTNTLSGAL